ncbi:YesK family protein [Rossellomorea sp. NPDC077527]|uniref:YesK family protein n=1 Tax=Rossellomorea sp. NPDC077527 TaxID=3364510 RepID=UPI0037C7E7D8
MKYFLVIFISITIFVSVLAAYLIKKNPTKKHHVLPGAILTVVSFILAITSLFTTDGWSIMGYFFLLVFVSVSSFIGTILGKEFGRRLGK